MENGKTPACEGPFGGRQIEFPVDFDLKVIMDMKVSMEQNRARLAGMLDRLGIGHRGWNHKYSSGGKFVSFTIHVDIDSRETMDSLYVSMKEEPSIRFAV